MQEQVNNHTTRPCISGTSGCFGPQLNNSEEPSHLRESRCPWCRENIQWKRAEEAEALVKALEFSIEVIKTVVNKEYKCQP